jgi:ABC-type phosphate/phosphonate transport system substrate-binding protein
MQKRKLHILVQSPWRVCLALLFLLAVPLNQIEAAAPPAPMVRIGFTSTMFNDANENDAKASMKAWGQTLARQHGVPADPEPLLFKNSKEVLTALQNKTVDMVAVSILEYETLQQELALEHIFLSVHNRQVSEEYLLVVHRDGGVKSLGDLAGRHVLLQHHIRLCLAPLWLDKLLVERGFAPIDSFADRVTCKSRLSQVLLPVFFKQADACVVSRRGLETIAELNPQIGRELMVLESSSKMIPALFAFRRDFAPPYMESLLEALRKLHETIDGHQVLLVFQCEKIAEESRPVLSPSLELISSYSQFMKN